MCNFIRTLILAWKARFASFLRGREREYPVSRINLLLDREQMPRAMNIHLFCTVQTSTAEISCSIEEATQYFFFGRLLMLLLVCISIPQKKSLLIPLDPHALLISSVANRIAYDLPETLTQPALPCCRAYVDTWSFCCFANNLFFFRIMEKKTSNQTIKVFTVIQLTPMHHHRVIANQQFQNSSQFFLSKRTWLMQHYNKERIFEKPPEH